MRGGAADLRFAPVTQAVASESIQRLDLPHRQWTVEYQQLIQQAPLCRRRGPADTQHAGRAAADAQNLYLRGWPDAIARSSSPANGPL